MNLKAIIIGALSTLLVTILGGIGVYYWTKEDKPKEDLQYTIDPTVDFTTSDTSLLIQNIQLINNGTALSENIVFQVELNSFETIINKSITFSSGNVAKYEVKDSSKKRLNIEILSLLPNEKVKVTLLIKSLNSTFRPIVNVRSKNSLGEEKPWDSGETEKTTVGKINEYLSLLLPLLLIIQLVLFLPTLLARIRRLYHHNNTIPLNNSAFLLLHKNQIQEAHQILIKTLKEKGGDSHILANYALSLSKKGRLDKAYKFIEAADFYANSNHEKAVVNFNKCLIELIDDKLPSAKKSIELALQQSRKEIKKYIEFSDIVKTLRNDPEVDKLFK